MWLPQEARQLKLLEVKGDLKIATGDGEDEPSCSFKEIEEAWWALKFLHMNYGDLLLITTTEAGWKIPHFNLGFLKISKG